MTFGSLSLISAVKISGLVSISSELDTSCKFFLVAVTLSIPEEFVKIKYPSAAGAKANRFASLSFDHDNLVVSFSLYLTWQAIYFLSKVSNIKSTPCSIEKLHCNCFFINSSVSLNGHIFLYSFLNLGSNFRNLGTKCCSKLRPLFDESL